MKEIQRRYLDASKEYVEKEKLNKDVIGIIVSGSMLYSTIDKNSDIDIHLILNPNCDYRERGNLWIDGIEIEYFKNPPIQIRSYFKREMKSPHTAHMLANGAIRYKQSDIIDELVAEAIEIINEKPKAISEIEIELTKYGLDDLYKDLEDALINQEWIGVELIRTKIINKSIDTFCKVNRIWRTKDKRLRNQLEKIDPEYVAIIQAAMDQNWRKNTSMDNLREMTEKLLGGRRTNEWKLRSNLDI